MIKSRIYHYSNKSFQCEGIEKIVESHDGTHIVTCIDKNGMRRIYSFISPTESALCIEDRYDANE